MQTVCPPYLHTQSRDLTQRDGTHPPVQRGEPELAEPIGRVQ